jgi:hypothetical protein
VEIAHVLLVILFVKVNARALVAPLAIFKADFGESNFLCCMGNKNSVNNATKINAWIEN